jgi:diacylglycerol kinase (ATP)
MSILPSLERASIIFNPIARNAPPRQRLLTAAAVWKLRGWEIEVRESVAELHATALAREAAAAGSRVVFACGGDGTVNEVVNGLVGTPARLGVLRGGTGNVFGKEVRVPRKVERALEVLASGREYRFDLGYAEGEGVVGVEALERKRRYFLLMAGIGFDGAVVRRVPGTPKRLLGTASYVLWGAAEALRFKSREVSLVLDGQRRTDPHLYWMLLGNTRSYGGVADVALQAVADDGLLDVYMFDGGGIPWIIGTGARIALKRHQNARGVNYVRARSLALETPGLQVQADGEYFGESPMTFGVEPRALPVLLSPGAPARIIRAG